MASSLTQTRAQSVSETTLLGACRDGEQSAAGGSEAGSRIQQAIFRHLPGETKDRGIKRDSQEPSSRPPKVTRKEGMEMSLELEEGEILEGEESQQGSSIDRTRQVVLSAVFGQEGVRGFQSTRSNGRNQASSDFQRSKEINGQIVEAGKRRDVARLWEILEGESRSFNEVNISTWIYQCAKQSNASELFQDPRFETTKTVLLEQLSQFGSQSFSNTAWAFATVGMFDRDVFGRIAEEIRARRDLRDFNPQDLSNTAWTFAKAEMFDRDVFGKIAEEIRARRGLRDFKPRELSNTAWAYATAEMFDRGIFERIAGEIRARRDLRDFNPQDLSNTAWTFAKAEMFDRDVFGKIAEEIRARRDLRDFNPQDLSNTAWTFAKAEMFDRGVFGKIAEEIRARRGLRDFKPQELSNTVWAFATAEMFDRDVFGKIAEEIRARRDLRDFNPQDLSNTAWTFAKAEMFDRDVFGKIAEEIRARRDLRDFNPQDLSNTAWTFAKAEMFDRGVFGKIAEEIRARRDLRYFNPQNLSNTAWALAIYCVYLADKSTEACLKEIVQNLLARVSHGSLSLEDRSQVGLAAAFFKIETDCLDVQASSSSRVSNLEREVQRYLPQEFIPQKDLGRECAHHIADFYHEIDRMVIEVDGPSHFYLESNKPLVHTILRNAILERHGFKVKSICYRDWDRLHSKEDKRAYIETLLRQE